MAKTTAKRRRAVALHYDARAYAAPRVVAAGAGAVADNILRLAQEYNVPVHEDRDLVALLAQLDVGAIIPPELYAAVAEVLAFVYRLKLRAERRGTV
jgi:flagellar biosynthesis protein